MDYARFLQQYGEGTGDYTRDRHQWLREETSSALHSQTALLAANGALPRLEGAKMLCKEDQKHSTRKIPITPGEIPLKE